MRMELSEKYLWVEKYRPRSIDDLVLPDEYRSAFRKYVEDKEIPHLLLIGTQGSGKTTLARILIKEIQKDIEDCLILNGSSSTGVDVVRNQIEEFLKVPAFGGSKIKIIFIDEFDYMSGNAMAALRNIMERYSDIGRFLMTANYKSKIIDPIFSRTTVFEFKKLPKTFIEDYVRNILEKERVKHNPVFVEKVITLFYPDVRRIVNTLQGKVNENNEIEGNIEDLVSNEKRAISYVIDICFGIKNKNMQIISKSIADSMKLLRDVEIDYISCYQQLFEDPKIPPYAKVVINQYANGHQSCLIPAMHWCSMLYEIARKGKELLQIGQQYQTAVMLNTSSTTTGSGRRI